MQRVVALSKELDNGSPNGCFEFKSSWIPGGPALSVLWLCVVPLLSSSYFHSEQWSAPQVTWPFRTSSDLWLINILQPTSMQSQMNLVMTTLSCPLNTFVSIVLPLMHFESISGNYWWHTHLWHLHNLTAIKKKGILQRIYSALALQYQCKAYQHIKVQNASESKHIYYSSGCIWIWLGLQL